MDNKVTKQRFLTHLRYDWLKYVAVLIVGVFVFVLAYSWMGNLRTSERLKIMFTCYEFYDQEGFEEDAIEYLNDTYPNNIVQDLSVYTVSATNENWGESLNAYGFDVNVIMLILPENKMEEWASWFMPMQKENDAKYNRDIWDRIIPEGLNLAGSDLYWAEKEGVRSVYGIRVDNLVNIKSAFKFNLTAQEVADAGLAEYDYQKYYLVMHYRNMNIGEYGTSKKYKNHYEGFGVIRYFLQRYGVKNAK